MQPSMTRSLILAAGLLSALPFTGTALAAGDPPVATVNGKPISQKVYEMYLKQRQSQAGKAGHRRWGARGSGGRRCPG